jgi:hypothetical protein
MKGKRLRDLRGFIGRRYGRLRVRGVRGKIERLRARLRDWGEVGSDLRDREDHRYLTSEEREERESRTVG